MSVCEKREKEEDVHIHKPASPEPSCVSIKSNRSILSPPEFSDGAVTSVPDAACTKSLYKDVQTHKTKSSDLSCVSIKSDRSILSPPEFSDEAVTSDPDAACKKSDFNDVQTHQAKSPEPSCVSIKSDRSILSPPEFSDLAVTSDPELKTEYLIRSVMPHQTLIRQSIKDQHKTCMKNKYERLFEGIKLEGNQTLLNRIYTQLYIIEGESEGVNEEHEVLQMEKTARTQDTPIYCNDIFKPLHQSEYKVKDKIKTVLTKGIAGIGKTVSVQKFILDWSEGKANQDVDLMFVLPFRELNLIKDHQYSLHRLLLDFHPDLQDLHSQIYEECKVVFIFDGLDESRMTLKFSDIERVSDVNESSSVDVLMSNLIRGDLLPSAHIWITSRPAATNQIPSEYISRLTEIQGFNESQKEEYFRKRISDEHQASRIISHIRRTRSLHIMCHIPVFCWISATVLQNLLNQDDGAEIPQTLTEMYIHFLLTQISMRNQKYDERDPEKQMKSNRDVILKLAELAFRQLMKGNVMFYEEDLIESGIDVTDASVYSGICTEIFKEESVIHQRKVYAFVHLSFQEFLAALNQFYFHIIVICKSQDFQRQKPLHFYPSHELPSSPMFDTNWPESLSRSLSHTRSSELPSPRLFDTNWPESLSRSLSHTRSSELPSTRLFDTNWPEFPSRPLSHTRSSELPSPCLFDTNWPEFPSRPLSHTRSSELPSPCLLDTNWPEFPSRPLSSTQSPSAPMYDNTWPELPSQSLLLHQKPESSSYGQTSLYEQLILELNKSLESRNGHLDLYIRFLLGISLESNQRLLQALLRQTVKNTDTNTINQMIQFIKDELKSDVDLSADRCINLFLCLLEMKDQTLYKEIQEFVKSNHSVNRLSSGHCSTIAYMLQISEEVLDEFDLRKYNTSVEGRRRLIPAVVKCRKAQLAFCELTVQCCETLSSCLQSSNLLRELDLSHNDLWDLGVKMLSDGLKSPHCQLNVLRLTSCSLTGQCCESLSSCLQSSNSLRELDLSKNDLQDSGVKLLSDGLKSSHCQLNTLRFDICNLTDQCCDHLSSCLQSSNSLRELDLSHNDLQDSGVKLLSDGLKSSHCQLNKMRLSGCNLTGQCCASLSSCLQSSNSLRELDLSHNDLQDSGVKLLSDGLKSPHCQLNILSLSGCMVTKEGCRYLASALRKNPLHLRELDLSYNHPGDSLDKLLSDPNYTLNKLNKKNGGKIRIVRGLQKYACELTLDINTANTFLVLSENKRNVTCSTKEQQYPDHPERFDETLQVLCEESLSGRCYWEAELNGIEVSASVTYKGISRKGWRDDCCLGFNEKSWSLTFFSNYFTVKHKNKERKISVPSDHCNKVGFYLDWPVGALSFYSVSETHTLTHLHTFNTTFTEPLYAGFSFMDSDSSASLCNVKQLKHTTERKKVTLPLLCTHQ